MRRKKLNIPKKFIVAAIAFFLLIGVLVCLSLRKDEEKSESAPPVSEQENLETGGVEEKNYNEEDELSVPEVNAENDREHSLEEMAVPIEGAQDHIEPIMYWRQYLLQEKLITFIERYAPEAQSAVCLSSAPHATNPDIICFYLELDNPEGTIVEAEYDTNIKQVTVRECTQYTKEEIVNEVWITGGAPAVRDAH